MVRILECFWGIAMLELGLWLVPPLSWQRLLAPFVAIPLGITSVALFIVHPSVPTGLLLLMSLYRIVNLLRLVSARIHEKYLRRATLQASFWVIGLQATLLLVWYGGIRQHISTYHLWILLAYADFAVAAVLLSATLRNVRTTRAPRLAAADIADRDLPTLTVAIPARNETTDLEACLTSLVASNYPKLEILVLDDCSQNRRTPEIIRTYAHDGVRFIQGNVPQENWLAKNQAYQQLLDESNGELALFCGVDVRFAPDSLRLLVAAMLHKHKTMISVIPRNTIPPVGGWRHSTLLQPMRYAWELALPRKLFRRPPVLSTCWIVRRDMLDTAGGFGAVSRSIVPENYFARVSAMHDGYSFMQSSSAMGITSAKSQAEQFRTVIRTRYPQVHRRIELVLLLTMAELMCILLPYGLLAMAIFGRLSLHLAVVAALTLLMLTAAYAAVILLTYRVWLARSLLALPAAIIADVILLNYSMLAYEFFAVSWKGRNVCIPVMHVTAHLPPAE